MAAAAFAGLIVGSGAAAWAQTDGASSSSSDSSSSDGSAPAPPAPGEPGFHHHHGGDPANCPNMGPDGGSSSYSNDVPSAYSGA